MTQRISLGEYADRIGLKTPLRRAFELHVKLTEGTFDYRTEEDWQRLYAQFRALPRMRRGAQDG